MAQAFDMIDQGGAPERVGLGDHVAAQGDQPVQRLLLRLIARLAAAGDDHAFETLQSALAALGLDLGLSGIALYQKDGETRSSEQVQTKDQAHLLAEWGAVPPAGAQEPAAARLCVDAISRPGVLWLYGAEGIEQHPETLQLIAPLLEALLAVAERAGLFRGQLSGPLRLQAEGGMASDPSQSRPSRAEVKASRRQINRALETLDLGFAFYDSQDRLIYCNPRFRRFYPQLADVLVPGTPHRKILLAALQYGRIANEAGEILSDEVLFQERAPSSKASIYNYLMPSGHVSRISVLRMPSGERIETHSDVSVLAETQARLANVVKSSNIGTWEWDVSSGRMHVNERWASILGYRLDELDPEITYDTWRERVHPDDLSVTEDQFYRGFDNGETVIEAEYRLRHRDGHWVWILDHSQVLRRDSDGRPLLMAGIEIDISDRKAREQALIEAKRELEQALTDRNSAEARFYDIAAVSDAWFWEQDADLRFTFRSRRPSLECLGLRNDDLMGLTRREWLKIYPDVAASADWSSVIEAQDRREAFSDFVFRAPLEGADGEKWFRISGVPSFDSAGQFIGYRGVGADVTELYLAKSRAELASQAKSIFLANMSHEIRTPLNGVLGMAEVLEGVLSTPEQKRMIGTIRRSGRLLLTILNDILDMSKIEAGKLEMETLAFEPAEVARRVHDLHGPIANEKGVDLDLMIGNGADGLRMGDSLRFQQILNNLISNAIKFTETGEVVIRLSGKPDRPLVLEVRDTGIGMTEAQLDRVNGDFAQGDSSISRRFGGTGLGLAITQRLVKMMNGGMEIRSRLGEGTTIRVTLPLASTSVQDLPSAQPPGQDRADLSGLRLLVADDNATNCMVMQLILEGCGATVVTTSDGLEAVNTWKPGLFDAVLLDIAMPIMDGQTALIEIRKREREAQLQPAPILAVTANAMPHQVADYIAAGFDTCIAKPVNAADLSRSVRRLVDCQ